MSTHNRQGEPIEIDIPDSYLQRLQIESPDITVTATVTKTKERVLYYVSEVVITN